MGFLEECRLLCFRFEEVVGGGGAGRGTRGFEVEGLGLFRVKTVSEGRKPSELCS